jgi:hypothetical protein
MREAVFASMTEAGVWMIIITLLATKSRLTLY